MAPVVDKRCLLNRDLVAKMLDRTGRRPRRGSLYPAFFATLCYAGLLFPGEKGGMPAGSVFRRVWAKAREEILSDYEPAIYARCIVGQRDDYLRRVESVQDLPPLAA
ncbi:hypothetical protein [Streptomyces sp. NBC_01716]|uniref:hypothetical protein n=1 Tax=Streptomyces sp. NBC_01716 TaxID=2975917 RepID=UPI002E3238FD|nr:hypothetical protein [Streptomyces sp. NBC_01716]